MKIIRCAALGLLSIAMTAAVAQRLVELPTWVLNPTNHNDCADLERRWSAVTQRVIHEHQECIASRLDGEQRGLTCDVGRCQSLHNMRAQLISGDLQRRRQQQAAMCREDVAAFVERRRQMEKQQRAAEGRGGVDPDESIVSLRNARRVEQSTPKYQRNLQEALARYAKRLYEQRTRAAELERQRDLADAIELGQLISDGIKDIGDLAKSGVRYAGPIVAVKDVLGILLGGPDNGGSLDQMLADHWADFQRVERDVEERIWRERLDRNLTIGVPQPLPLRAPGPSIRPTREERPVRLNAAETRLGSAEARATCLSAQVECQARCTQEDTGCSSRCESGVSACAAGMPSPGLR